MEENRKIETIRDLEFLNLVFLQTEDQSIILKYNKLIFRRLESFLLALTNVVEFDHISYLPVGVITAMVSFLFEKLMKFYHEDLYKHETQSNENPILHTKILCDSFIKIWIKLSKECTSCIHELVLESMTNCIKYLELDKKIQKDLFCICFDLVRSNCYPVEISAYTVLDRFDIKQLLLYFVFNLFIFLIIYTFYNSLDCVNCIMTRLKLTPNLMMYYFKSKSHHYSILKIWFLQH